jgi:hypothetical protein
LVPDQAAVFGTKIAVLEQEVFAAFAVLCKMKSGKN